MGTEAAWIPAVMALIGTGVSVANTRSTERRQDAQAAQSVRNQAGKQKEADARVGEEVEKLKASTAEDERKQRMADYMQTIQRSKQPMTEGLTPQVGSDAFKADAADAAQGVQDYAANRAGLLSRIDGATLQRQNEGVGFGNLATDIGLIQRQSQGDAFLNELRMRAIRRNPWMDAAATTIGAAGSAYGSYGGGTTSTGVPGSRMAGGGTGGGP